MNTRTFDRTRFSPGSFIELDDLLGGRKISLVCDDGITAVDNVHPDKALPVLIHPKFNPLVIGQMHEFLIEHSLQNQMTQIITYMTRKEMGDLYFDSLLMMRIMFQINQRYGNQELSDKDYGSIITSCQQIQKELDDINALLLGYIHSSRQTK